MSDEKLYLQATSEVESENKDAALWSKSIVLAEGDQEKAKYQYIKLRVSQLSDEPRSEFERNYMPVSEFSEIQSIEEGKVIKLIKDGFYSGQYKDNKWYITRKDIKWQERISDKTGGSPKVKSGDSPKVKSGDNSTGWTTEVYLGLLVLSFIIPIFGWIYGGVQINNSAEDSERKRQAWHYVYSGTASLFILMFM